MKEATRRLLEKASRAIHSAELLLGGREVEFAAGRGWLINAFDRRL